MRRFVTALCWMPAALMLAVWVATGVWLDYANTWHNIDGRFCPKLWTHVCRRIGGHGVAWFD